MSRDLIQDALAHPLSRQLPSDFDANSAIYLPPPAPTRGYRPSRTATDLPPLYNRTQSTSPSRSAFLPFLRPQSLRSVSPERVSVASESAVSDESSGTKKKTSTAAEKLASWFDGSSEPVNITLVPSPRKEKLDPVSEHGTMENIFSASQDPTDNLTRRPQKRPSLASPAPSKFNFFRRSTVSLAPNNLEGDELANLDIDQALFPHGPPDEFSPAAFKNLQLNAEGTIRRFQQAYTDQQRSLRMITSAKNIQTDELEAAQTRNEHLKLQLEEMAERAVERERTITDLRAQLATQRPPLESQPSQHQSVRMVPPEGCHESDPSSRSRYRRKRSSDVSTSGESELGSDVSSVVSVFSEVMSAAPSQTISIPSPVVKSNTSAGRGDCPNCHGLTATDSWDVVNVMRLESAALKQRIAQLENAQDDALDFLSGLKLS